MFQNRESNILKDILLILPSPDCVEFRLSTSARRLGMFIDGVVCVFVCPKKLFLTSTFGL